MSDGAPANRPATRLAAWLAAWIGCAAVWLLLVDNPALPELLTGVVAAAIGATGTELVRARRIARLRPRARWLTRVGRPVARAPRDLLLVIGAVARQVAKREPRRGRILVVPFEHGGEDERAHARRALAEAFGSFAPNTIVIGVDDDRDEIVVHELVRSGDPAKAADPMGLA
jgi:multisubunit Na+/H+ antiporter MnhE subunit